MLYYKISAGSDHVSLRELSGPESGLESPKFHLKREFVLPQSLLQELPALAAAAVSAVLGTDDANPRLAEASEASSQEAPNRKSKCREQKKLFGLCSPARMPTWKLVVLFSRPAIQKTGGGGCRPAGAPQAEVGKAPTQYEASVVLFRQLGVLEDLASCQEPSDLASVVVLVLAAKETTEQLQPS